LGFLRRGRREEQKRQSGILLTEIRKNYQQGGGVHQVPRDPRVKEGACNNENHSTTGEEGGGTGKSFPIKANQKKFSSGDI